MQGSYRFKSVLTTFKDQDISQEKSRFLGFPFKTTSSGDFGLLGRGGRGEDRSQEPVLSFQTSLVTATFVKSLGVEEKG